MWWGEQAPLAAVASRRSVKQKRSTLPARLITWSSWRMRATAGCSWVAASRWTTDTSGVQRTSSRRPTGGVLDDGDAECAFQTPSSPRISRAPTTSSRTSKPPTSASEVERESSLGVLKGRLHERHLNSSDVRATGPWGRTGLTNVLIFCSKNIVGPTRRIKLNGQLTVFC